MICSSLLFLLICFPPSFLLMASLHALSHFSFSNLFSSLLEEDLIFFKCTLIKWLIGTIPTIAQLFHKCFSQEHRITHCFFPDFTSHSMAHFPTLTSSPFPQALREYTLLWSNQNMACLGSSYYVF